MGIIVPDPPTGYGFYDWRYPFTCGFECCAQFACLLGPPTWTGVSYCGTYDVLRHEVKPNETVALGLDMPFFFVRGCDGEYRVISFVSAS